MAGPRAADVIVITGAGGFLGSHVVPLVRRAAPQARVVAVVRRDRRTAWPEPGVEIIAGDLRLARSWRQIPATVTHVIHLAAMIPWGGRDPSRPAIVHDNLTPIAHLVHASAGWKALRGVVYGSSVSVYAASARRLRESSVTTPATLYGAAKLAGERLLDVLAHRGIAVASLRYSSLYGAGQYQGTVLPVLVDRARRGLSLELFNARRVQDFLHVEDAAHATWLACRKSARGAFNVGTGQSVSMTALARAVLRTFDAGGASGIVVRTQSATGDVGIRLDVGRARRELGYSPRLRLTDGLTRLARELPVGAP